MGLGKHGTRPEFEFLGPAREEWDGPIARAWRYTDVDDSILRVGSIIVMETQYVTISTTDTVYVPLEKIEELIAHIRAYGKQVAEGDF